MISLTASENYAKLAHDLKNDPELQIYKIKLIIQKSNSSDLELVCANIKLIYTLKKEYDYAAAKSWVRFNLAKAQLKTNDPPATVISNQDELKDATLASVEPTTTNFSTYKIVTTSVAGGLLLGGLIGVSIYGISQSTKKSKSSSDDELRFEVDTNSSSDEGDFSTPVYTSKKAVREFRSSSFEDVSI